MPEPEASGGRCFVLAYCEIGMQRLKWTALLVANVAQRSHSAPSEYAWSEINYAWSELPAKFNLLFCLQVNAGPSERR